MANQKTIPIQSRLDKNGYNKLSDLANHKGLSISMLVRLILIQHLEAK